MDPRLDRINKLIRLSENNPSSQEAAAAKNKALELTKVYIQEQAQVVKIENVDPAASKESRQPCPECHSTGLHAENCSVKFFATLLQIGCEGCLVLMVMMVISCLISAFVVA